MPPNRSLLVRSRDRVIDLEHRDIAQPLRISIGARVHSRTENHQLLEPTAQRAKQDIVHVPPPSELVAIRAR